MTEPRVVLHVGAMKSGTTYLQSCLFDNKPLLRRNGVLLPGREWRSQARAVHGLLHSEGRQWRKMAARMAAHDGLSVVSMEFLAAASAERAREVRATLGDESAVSVVISARDLNRSIPAMWQESVQNGRTWTWQRFHEAVVADRPSRKRPAERSLAGAHFWRQQDLSRIAKVWGEVVGPEQVSIVTVPPPGSPRDLLWQRFAAVVGIDAELIEPVQLANESLGAASAQVMRRLNELLDEADLGFAESQVARKRLLSKQVLAARKGAEPAIGLPVAPWVQEETDAMVAGLVDTGVQLVGDWGDLKPVDVAGIDPGHVDQALLLETALGGLAGFLTTVVRDPQALSV